MVKAQKKWTEDAILQGIKEVQEKAGIDFMPSNDTVVKYSGNYGLSAAIQKNGGYEFWANRLGLTMTRCETRFGQFYEQECFGSLSALGYSCEKMTTKYPYDILAENVKIDVKASRLYHSKQGAFYTFNLEKANPTCDIYVAYCVSDDNEIVKTYIIPSVQIQGKTQLSIGETRSKYDKYIDAWDIVAQYNNFYNSFI